MVDPIISPCLVSIVAKDLNKCPKCDKSYYQHQCIAKETSGGTTYTCPKHKKVVLFKEDSKET